MPKKKNLIPKKADVLELVFTPPSKEMLKLARQAVASQQRMKAEEAANPELIHEWAARLARDLAAFDD